MTLIRLPIFFPMNLIVESSLVPRVNKSFIIGLLISTIVLVFVKLCLENVHFSLLMLIDFLSFYLFFSFFSMD